VYQDNKSAILLEKNGKASSSKRTSTSDSSLWLIRLHRMSWMWNGVPLKRWLGISSPKHYEELYSRSSGTLSWGSQAHQHPVSLTRRHCCRPPRWSAGILVVKVCHQRRKTISKTKILAPTETKNLQLSPQECVGGCTQVTHGGCTRVTCGPSKFTTPLAKTYYGHMPQYPTKISRKNMPKSAVGTLILNSLLVN